MKTATEWKEEIMDPRALGSFGLRLIDYIEAIRQEQREACAEESRRIAKLHLHPDNLLFDEELEDSVFKAVLNAGKEE